MYKIGTVTVLVAALVPFSFALSYQENYVRHFKEVVEATVSKFQNEQFNINNGECVEQIKLFFANLWNSTSDDIWALRMIDASAKIPAGLLDLNFAWIGDYDECLDIQSALKHINGKYCLITISLEGDLSGTEEVGGSNNFNVLKGSQKSKKKYAPNLPSIGICIPNKCTGNDIEGVLEFLGTFNLSYTWKTFCQTKEDRYPSVGTGAAWTLAFFGSVVCLMIASTIYDLTARCNNRGTPHPLLSVFSVYTNGQKLFRLSRSPDEFSCLNGIRVLSMCWVILYHIFYLNANGPVLNFKNVAQFVTEWKSQIFANAPFSVDSFLVVTGMLIVYNFKKSSLKSQKFDLFQFYLHRFIRLTPPILPIMLVCMYLSSYIGAGPFYPELDAAIGGPCRHNWWAVLLHIQNYVYDFDDMCLSQTWYIDVDWQLYLLAPIFLLFLPKHSKLGIGILLAALTGTIVTPWCLTIDKKLSSSNFNGNIDNYEKFYYFKTHNRAAPWIIGALLGYILAKIKLEKQLSSIKMPKFLIGFMWILTICVMSACIFGAHDAQTSSEYHTYSDAFFNGFARPAWGVSVAWMIFASSIGYGGLVNSILSQSFFQILNRFSYSIYLVHLPMLFVITYSQNQPRHFSVLNMLYSFPQILILGFGISIFWTLAFEIPIVGIELYFRQPKTKPKQEHAG